MQMTTKFPGQLLLVLLLLGIITSLGCTRSPQQKEAKFLESGKKYLAKKDFLRAELQFQNAARVAPKDPEPYHQLGVAYLEGGSVIAGIQALTAATQVDPKHVAS